MSTIVRAHQHTAGAHGASGRRGRRSELGRFVDEGGPDREPDDYAIDRSRGGLTTKVHLAADDRCRPLAFVLTAGQTGMSAFADVMAHLRAPRPESELGQVSVGIKVCVEAAKRLVKRQARLHPHEHDVVGHGVNLRKLKAPRRQHRLSHQR